MAAARLAISSVVMTKEVAGEPDRVNFHGSRRTAQNYMRLAETASDVSAFQGLSLRQVYLRLGIATEPKSRTNSPRVAELPAHIRLASRLLVALKACEKKPQAPEAFRQDLRALYERLRQLFEPEVR